MRAILAGAAAALAIGAAPALAVTWNLTFNCVTNCAAQGLAEGDRATVTLALDDASFRPRGSITRFALQSFRVVAGTYTADFSEFVALDATGYWRDTIDRLPQISFIGSTVIDPDLGNHPPLPSKTVSMSAGFTEHFRYLTTAPAGSCRDSACSASTYGGDYANFVRQIAPIPLPAPLLPLIAALGALFAVGWRHGGSRA